MFGGMACGKFWPERRKFMTPKTGGHANPGIVKCDGMAAQERKKAATERGQPMAQGFRGREKGGDSCKVGKEFPEYFSRKVVEKKVGQNQFRGWGVTDPFEGFGVDNGRQPVLAAQLIEAGVGDRRLPIHQQNAASSSPRGKGQGKNAG